jgi:hypothetical protein
MLLACRSELSSVSLMRIIMQALTEASNQLVEYTDILK